MGYSASVRMVAVQRLDELLARLALRLALRDRDVAGLVRDHARELALRKARIANDVGHEPHHLRPVLGQHRAADARFVIVDADGQRAAHATHLLLDLRGRARARALAQHLAGDIRQRDLVALLVDVSRAHIAVDRHLGHGAEAHERDLHPVRERELVLRRQHERLGRSERRRRFALRVLRADRSGGTHGERQREFGRATEALLSHDPSPVSGTPRSWPPAR